MFRWMLALGLLFVNLWLCVAIMLAIVDAPAASTFVMAGVAAIALTFLEVKAVEHFAGWRVPQMDPTPKQEYWGIGIAGAVVCVVAIWIVMDRAGRTADDPVRINRTEGPSNAGVGLEPGSAASARIDQSND